MLLHILKNLSFYEEDTLCMYLFLMAVLITVSGFCHKDIQKFVQTTMQILSRLDYYLTVIKLEHSV